MADQSSDDRAELTGKEANDEPQAEKAAASTDTESASEKAGTEDAGSPSVQGEPKTDEAPAGWFQDPNVPNQQRYWDGSSWTEQTREAMTSISTAKRSADERKALLAQQLQGTAARGFRVESQSEFQAVVVEGQPVNHVLHAIITIFSCGIWAIVWIILAITGGEKREMVVVDEFGNVQLQKLGKA